MGSPNERRSPRRAAETAQLERDPASSVIQHAPDTHSVYRRGELLDDRYRLEREIGRGGMGVVWIAHSLVLGIDVALKLIRSSETGPEGASRMAREAHAAARVGHPALVRVFDFGWTPHGDPYLVMELIRGEALSDWIVREKHIGALRAVQTLLPIADGLRLAHDRGIIHRDIKPANILLSKDSPSRPQPKLLDFGIAKVGASIDIKLTQVGTVLGSPEYMSPEQALGIEDIDSRTDVWSFCVALYEMLTGEVPFKGANYNALMQVIIHGEPTPITERGVGDAALWAVLKRGLQKERTERWKSMTELGTALAQWLFDRGVKDDISGNSLRAVWLGSNAQIIASSAPTASADATDPQRARFGGSVPNLWNSLRTRPRLALLGGLAAALLAIFVWPRSELPAAPSTASAPAALVDGARGAAVLPVADPAEGAKAIPDNGVGANPVATAAASGEPEIAASAGSSRAAKTPSPKRTGAPKPRTKPKAKRDFGF